MKMPKKMRQSPLDGAEWMGVNSELIKQSREENNRRGGFQGETNISRVAFKKRSLVLETEVVET